MNTSSSIFRLGKNCWKHSPASRVALLIDAKDYFESIVWAAERAERSLFILSWDIHSRIQLLHGRRENLNYWSQAGSLPLADFFLHLVKEKPDLHIYILTWDFMFFYANERESKASAIKRFRRHPRIRFEFDPHGPLLISHHQKIIVADEQLAFCGGLDITQRRWDTPTHQVNKAERRDPEGELYEPFHDVQMVVEGEAARDLGQIFRQRWQREKARPELPQTRAQEINCALWPEYLDPLFLSKKVAIARTIPAFREESLVRECEALFLDSIRQAKHYIFIENQYLTSRKIGDAIAERLRDPDPPEIVVLVRLHNSKWTEAASVAVLRAKLIRRLKAEDRKGRLLVLCPTASLKQGVCINLHSKVFISDDRILRVGSANLCGRSEGMDTECDLAIEAESNEERHKIRSVRNRLLAEHLGIKEEEVRDSIDREAGLIPAIRKEQKRRDRTLVECPDKIASWQEWMVPAASLVDPESPRQFAFALLRIPLFLSILALAFFLLPYFQSLFQEGTIEVWARSIQKSPFALLGLVAFFCFLCSLPLPLLPLAIAFAVLLPPWQTFFCIMGGAVLSAVTLYSAAKVWAIKYPVGWLSKVEEGERYKKIKNALEQEGLWPVLLLRLVPVAPFGLENFLMGLIGIKFRYFVSATILGLLPGFLMISFFEDEVKSGTLNLGEVALCFILFVMVGWGMQKGVRRIAGK